MGERSDTKLMDMTKKEQVIELLKFIRKERVCAYLGNRCDCKFGINLEVKDRVMSGESNGCPEMYQIIDFLEHLPDKAWEAAANLAQSPNRNMPIMPKESNHGI